MLFKRFVYATWILRSGLRASGLDRVGAVLESLRFCNRPGGTWCQRHEMPAHLMVRMLRTESALPIAWLLLFWVFQMHE